MTEDNKRSTWIAVAFLAVVLLVYYFGDIVGLMFKRYYSPYWSCNTVSAIMQMYSETPCVSKVRFDKRNDGKDGIYAVCYMRWDAGIEEDLQAYHDFCNIVNSDEFLSAYVEDVFANQDCSDVDRIYFLLKVVHKGRSQLWEDAFYELDVSEDGLKLVQTKPFPVCPIRMGY